MTNWVIRYKNHRPGNALPFGDEFDTKEAAQTWLINLYRNHYGYRTDHTALAAALGDYAIGQLEWGEIEQRKFSTGEYKFPCWVNERFWTDNSDIHRRHYAHVSVEDPTMLAFTESEEKGAAGRQTRMKPGRYLKKYFGEILSEKQLTAYSEWYAKGLRPKIEIDAELKFAKTRKQIVDVYDRGPHSCMSEKYCVEVYAAGDLAVAYLEGPDPQDKGSNWIMARALCWPAKKAFGRVYPNTDNWRVDGFDSAEHSEAARTKLFDALKAEGWTHIGEDARIFDGARIKVIRDEENGAGYYVMPYLDNALGVVLKGEHFVMTYDRPLGDERYRYTRPESTSGTCYIEHGWTKCQSCSGIVTFNTQLTQVYSGYRSGLTGLRRVCPKCAKGAFTCEGTGGKFLPDVPKVEVTTPTGVKTWVMAYAKDHATLCGREGIWFSGGAVYVNDLNQVWAQQTFAKHGFQCSYNRVNYPNEMESELYPGFPAYLDMAPWITADERARHRRSTSVRSEREANLNDVREGELRPVTITLNTSGLGIRDLARDMLSMRPTYVSYDAGDYAVAS